MRKALVFGLTISFAGAALYACSDSTDSTDEPTPSPDASKLDASSPVFGDVFVPDSRASNAVVLCVTQEAAARVVRFIDDGVNLSPAGTTLATGSNGTVIYRGVTFRPE